MLTLTLKQIKDFATRQVFERIAEFLGAQPILNAQWAHFEIEFHAPVPNYKFPHRLGFVPQDVLLTFESGSGSVAFNYDLFDKVNLDMTISGPVKIRFFVGRYEE